ncbi:uncharacterized protein METZ01_LOCUS202893, partial [marine metagenome]
VGDGRYARGESRTLGALTLTERFVRQDPPSHREIEVLRAEIDAQLSHHPLYCAEPWRTPDRPRRHDPQPGQDRDCLS